MNLTDFAQLAVAGGSAGGMFGLVFVFVRWTANFIAGRMDRREARLDAGMIGLIDGLKAEIARLSGECKDLRTAVAKHGDELTECRKKHAESEAEVMKLKAMLAGFGDARQHAQLIVSAEKKKDAAK